MPRTLLICLIFLGACNTAGPGFHGIPATRASAGGSDFLIRQRGSVAEVMRVSPERFPRFASVARRGVLATQQVTGCTVGWVQGDPSMMHMGLACGANPAPRMARRPRAACWVLRGQGSCR
ncbi:hypothetical protein VK792_00375 [Mesobacterium sp. TK19101]|uniref:Uncharacterized protein n=1 Tax=Mesobacterium hydrothermale TaxID=3111907 RepID=A0ABU6HC67_9RHOB|nr:hypothetical protein [Mesobacterium sp. TK19101]MEC3859722.1 hypothetical protein [Mesobacterium sp. TK19101]